MNSFDNIEPFKLYTKLQLYKQFHEDENPEKLDLFTPQIINDDGNYYQFKSIEQAQQIRLANPSVYTKDYPPQPGYEPFLQCSQKILLGDNNKPQEEQTIASVQTVSQQGGLTMVYILIKNHFPFLKNFVVFEEDDEIQHNCCFKDVTENQSKVHRFQNIQQVPLQLLVDINVFVLNDLKQIDYLIENSVDLTKSLIVVKLQYFDLDLKHSQQYINKLISVTTQLFIIQSVGFLFGLYNEHLVVVHATFKSIGQQQNLTVKQNLSSNLCNIIRQNWSMSPQNGAYLVQIAVEKYYDQFLEDLENIQKLFQKRISILKTVLAKEHCIGVFIPCKLQLENNVYLNEFKQIYIGNLNEKNLDLLIKSIKK